MTIRRFVKEVTPPFIIKAAHRARTLIGQRSAVEWEYVPEGWQARKNDVRIKGWNVQSILETYRAKWPQFLKSMEGTEPLGLAPDAIAPTRTDLIQHNIMMSYGYALALATRHLAAASLLDWGGGIGHYFILSQALMPGLQIDYHCKDVPILAEYGQTLFPEAHFYTDEKCFARKYDFVLASTSLHYSEDWADTLSKLAAATSGHLFVTQLPIVHRADSYVFVQRPYQYGYETEYLGWCLNRQEFLDRARDSGLQLIREFLIGHQPVITAAPEQCEYRGYLFKTASPQGTAGEAG